jgi:hypothetical protein
MAGLRKDGARRYSPGDARAEPAPKGPAARAGGDGSKRAARAVARAGCKPAQDASVSRARTQPRALAGDGGSSRRGGARSQQFEDAVLYRSPGKRARDSAASLPPLDSRARAREFARQFLHRQTSLSGTGDQPSPLLRRRFVNGMDVLYPRAKRLSVEALDVRRRPLQRNKCHFSHFSFPKLLIDRDPVR